MSAMSNYLENKLIDFLFRGIAYSPPATLEFALLKTAPTDAGGGVEVSGGSYARVPVTVNATNFAATNAAASTTNPSSGTSGTTSNNAAITFPAPTADWGVVTHIAIYDAHSSGNLLWWNPLAAPKTVNNADAAPKFLAAALSIQLDVE